MVQEGNYLKAPHGSAFVVLCHLSRTDNPSPGASITSITKRPLPCAITPITSLKRIRAAANRVRHRPSSCYDRGGKSAHHQGSRPIPTTPTNTRSHRPNSEEPYYLLKFQSLSIGCPNNSNPSCRTSHLKKWNRVNNSRYMLILLADC